MRSLHTTVLLALASSAWATSLRAQEAQALVEQRCSAELGRPCACDRTMQEATVCASVRYAYADSVLNAVYRVALEAETLPTEIHEGWRRDLLESQRAWIRFKELDCALVSNYKWHGGSAARAEELKCLTARTEARTRQLREHASTGTR